MWCPSAGWTTTCWAVNWHNKASVIKLVYLYSNKKKSPYLRVIWRREFPFKKDTSLISTRIWEQNAPHCKSNGHTLYRSLWQYGRHFPWQTHNTYHIHCTEASDNTDDISPYRHITRTTYTDIEINDPHGDFLRDITWNVQASTTFQHIQNISLRWLLAKYAQYIVRFEVTGTVTSIKINEIKFGNNCITEVCFIKVH